MKQCFHTLLLLTVMLETVSKEDQPLYQGVHSQQVEYLEVNLYKMADTKN